MGQLNMIQDSNTAIIVLNWNGEEVIYDCLESLREQTRKTNVIIVDNASTDKSPIIIREKFPEFSLLQLNENTGFAKGNNEGLAFALKKLPNLKYVALLNNDTKAQPDWIEKLVLALESNQECGIAASKLLCWDGKAPAEVIDSAGDLFYQHGLAGKRGFGEPKEKYFEDEYIFGACAGAALYRVEMINQIGFLDDDFFAYNEDVDLCFRAQLTGWNCIFVPEAVVWHRVSFSTKSFSDRSIYWSKRNSFWVMIKNMPAGIFFKYFFHIVGYNLLSDLRWLLGLRIKPVFKGRWDALLKLPSMLKKRKKIMANRKVTNKELDELITKETPWFVSLRRNVKRIFN